jgi:hypothetical protein
MSAFPVFYFDSDGWFGVVDSVARWFDLLATCSTDENVEQVLAAKMAPLTEVKGSPLAYFLGAAPVHDGKIPSFGFRREHLSGAVRLENWTKNRGTDLRALAAEFSKKAAGRGR